MASIFTSQTPTAPNAVEPGGISLGTTFVPAVNGTVTGIRFYAPTTVTGTWSGALYQPTTDDDPEGSGAGTLLGSGTLGAPPTPGAWNVIPLGAPVAVTAGVPYRAVYHNTEGRYVSTPSFGPFVSGGLVNGDLTAPANGVNSGGLGSLWNGTFRTGATIAYPSNSFGQGNYFADVIFEAAAVADGTADFPLVITVAAVGEVPSVGQGGAAFGLGLGVVAAGVAEAPRRIAPSEGSRLVYAIGAGLTRNLLARPSTAVTIYAAEAGSALADIETLAGAPIAGSILTTDQWSQLPLFRMPAGADTVWAQVAGGPRWPVYAREDDRLDLLESDVDQLQAQVAAIDVPPGLAGEVAELQADVAAIDGELTNLSSDVDGLSVAVNYAEADIDALQASDTSQNSAIAALDGRLDSAEASITALPTTYIPLTQKGAAGGVARLDGSGNVLNGASAIVPIRDPATSVVAETSFGAASAVGSSVQFARADHTHGTPVNPITAHLAAADPHTQYLLKSVATTKGDIFVATGSGTVVRVGVGTDGQVIVADALQASGVRWATAEFQQHLLLTGEEVISREMITTNTLGPLLSGRLTLTYFTARKTETINTIRTVSGTQASAGLTLGRVGVYSIDASGNGTLIGSTANNTTLWNAANNGYNTALTAPWAKVAGQRYAIGIIAVGTTMPNFVGQVLGNANELFAFAPVMCSVIAGQADLLASFTTGQTAAFAGRIHGIMLP